jgi:hypothetical protein
MKRFLYYLPERMFLRLGRKYELDGIKLVVFLQELEAANLVHQKVAAALRLVQETAPKYYLRIKKFTPNILVFGGNASSQAMYVSALALCNINRNYVRSEETSPADLASTLIHEATHGYLESLGIKYQEHLRKRIERICVLAELAFARRLPDAEELIEIAISRLMVTEESFSREAYVERELAEMEALGVWKWYIAFIRKREAKRSMKKRISESIKS